MSKKKTMTFMSQFILTVLLAAGWWVLPQPLRANPLQAPATASEDGPSRDVKNKQYFTDLKVLTHTGEQLRFYSDILKDKVVAINFFYVNCPTAQPALVTFFKLQKMLKEKLGKEILLLTLSVDPEKDTPAAVQEYVHKFNPGDGWLFLTGPVDTMLTINRRLGNTGRLPEGHLRLFLLGNLKAGHWMRMVEQAPVIALAEGLRSLADEE